MDNEIANRIRGTILATAIGNSLGGTCLGMTRKEIMFSIGVHGLRDFMPGLKKSLCASYEPGSLMADTLLGLALAETLIANDGKLIVDAFKTKLTTMLTNEEFLDAAPGAHCLLPLRRIADDLGPCEEGQGDSTHVNAAARAFPAGCLPDESSVVEIAIEQAKVSQADKRVAAGAAVVAGAVSSLVRGHGLQSEQDVRSFVKKHYDLAEKIDPRFAEAWDDIAPDLDYINPADELPYSLVNVESHVNETVPTAVGIFLIFRHDLEEAIAAAASSGGDTDTVAAIVGALSGAYHGASAIPERWLNRISHRDHLEKVADGLIGLWNGKH